LPFPAIRPPPFLFRCFRNIFHGQVQHFQRKAIEKIKACMAVPGCSYTGLPRLPDVAESGYTDM
ncbi:hypothetical protein AB1I98_25335, partial [Enterococcus avium]